MSRRFEGEDVDDHIDRVHAEIVQREVDDKADAKTLAMAQRTASGISPEVLSLQEAFAEGIRAGNRGNGASLNPYQDDTPEHHEWNRGRLCAISARFNARRYA